MSAAEPWSQSSWLQISTRAGLTCMTFAPAPNARRGSSEAGYTTPDVPIEKNKSQAPEAAKPALQAASGSISPNHTTPGLMYPLHASHRGGSRRQPSTGKSSEGRGAMWALPQSMHLGE